MDQDKENDMVQAQGVEGSEGLSCDASVVAHEQQRLQHEEASIEGMTFRQAMTELGQIVSDLESNTLELEESLAKYERGIALLRHLRASLAHAQQKVDVLMGELEQPTDDATIDTTLQKA